MALKNTVMRKLYFLEEFHVTWCKIHVPANITGRAYVTFSPRDATRLNILQAIFYYIFLKCAHRRWRKNKIRIRKVKKYWWENKIQ